MKIEIQFKDGRWLVNGKRLQEMNRDEQSFMDSFFREVKIERCEHVDEVNHFINRKSSEQNASIKYAELLK